MRKNLEFGKTIADKVQMQIPDCRFLALTLAFALSAVVKAENWPQWRGPSFNGTTTESQLPGENLGTNQIVWAAPMPGPSAATPVVWGDRVFVSAADKSSQEVIAIGIDSNNGKELWRHVLSTDHSMPGNNDMAAPSPVTDGEHVWFLTGNGALACFTKDGEQVWKRDLAADYGAFVVNFGYSSSPLLFDGKLYVLVLQNENPQKGGLNPDRQGPHESYLLALDPATGQTQWKHVRETEATDQSRESYVTPCPVVWNGRQELVLAGGECITGHDPASGSELWRWYYTPTNWNGKTQHVVPTPVAEDGLIFVVRPEHQPLYALRAGASGLVGDQQVAWTFARNKSWIASPLLYRGRLYVLQEEQRSLVCLDAKTGRELWDNKLPAKSPLQASPTGADGKIYLFSMTGEIIVLAAGDEYRELAYLKLDESKCRSTIVAANGRLFVRAGKNLYCIGESKGTASP